MGGGGGGGGGRGMVSAIRVGWRLPNTIRVLFVRDQLAGKLGVAGGLADDLGARARVQLAIDEGADPFQILFSIVAHLLFLSSTPFPYLDCVYVRVVHQRKQPRPRPTDTAHHRAGRHAKHGGGLGQGNRVKIYFRW